MEKAINDKINLLPSYHQLVYGIILTERLLPNYFAFHFIKKWGNPLILLNGIDLLKNIVRLKTYDTEEIELINELIEEATPDMDDFLSNILASFALDISSMLYDCFAFVKNQKTKHIENCSKISFGLLEMFIQKRDNLKYDLPINELNEYFSKDELITNEIEYQKNLLNDLYSEALITNKLYIEKTMKTPNIALDTIQDDMAI